jgi:hypothetical protein
MRQAKFENGDELKDKVTGLKGIVMVVAFYSSGCIHYGVQPRALKDKGTPAEWVWLDEGRYSLVKKGAISFNIDEHRPSGPMPKGLQA